MIVLVIFLGNQLIRYLNDAAAGNMALGVLGRLLLLEIPYLLGLLLPLTFFIALLLTLGKLSADHEMIVLKACGFSPWQQWQMVNKPCLFLIGFVAILALFIQPKLALYRNQLLATTNAGASLETLVPGKFQGSANNRFIFYVEQSSVDHKQLHNIFIAEKRPGPNNDYTSNTQWNVLKASHGQLIEDPRTKAEFVEVQNGKRYVGESGTANYQVMSFERYLILARNPSASAVGNEMDAFSTSELFTLLKLGRWNDPAERLAAAELEWRISLPLACFLLSLLALKLGEVPPRHGRYARIFPGALILIIYANMLFVFRNWVASGHIKAFPGIGWLHLFFIFFLLAYLIPWQYVRVKQP